MLNYLYDCYTILNKVYSEKSFVKQAINSTIIEEKNRSLVVKTCYGVIERDIELSYYMEKLAPKTPKLAIRTLLKISMYAIKYLDKKPYAVTENAVALVKKLGKGGASGFCNAFLRNFINKEIPLPTNQVENLSVKYSYPVFAIKELLKYYSQERVEEIIKPRLVKTALSFYQIDGENYLTEKNIPFEKTPFANVFTVENFVRNEDFDKGVYTYQALGSVAICDVVERGETLLDCCSAPGGKSIRLSHKFNKVTSWDIHEHRVQLIKSYKTRMGVKNIFETQADAKIYNRAFEKSFSAVLADVVCSGLGVVNDNPDIKLNRNFESLKEITDEQFNIINTVKNYVQVGGHLYYSTCSILKKENDKIIEKFLNENNGFKIEKIESPLNNEKTEYGLQFMPDISGGLGFYVAKLKREN